MIVVKISQDKRTGQTVQTLQSADGSRLRLFGRMSLTTLQMKALADVGILVIKNRVAKSIGSDDQKFKPLTKRYAIRKTRMGKGNMRNMSLSGDMLRNISVRSISETEARIDITSAKERKKARINEARTPWYGWSNNDIRQLTAAAQAIFKNVVQISSGSGGRRVFGNRPPWMDPLGYMDRSFAGTGIAA